MVPVKWREGGGFEVRGGARTRDKTRHDTGHSDATERVGGGGEVTAPKRGREAKTWRARRELGSTEVLARGTKPEVLEIAPSVFSRKRSEKGPEVMIYFFTGSG